MNYLTIPGQQVPISSESNLTEVFLPKDSFLSNAQHLSSTKYIPQISSNHPHSSAYVSFPQQRNNIRKQFQDLKETVAEFKKSLQNSNSPHQPNITQKTQISNVIRTLFNSLRQIIKSNRNSEDFQWVFEQYIYALRRKENSQHFFTQVSGHLKEILGSSQLTKLRRNRKIFIFLSRIFPECPHTVHKILMNKIEIFQNETSKEAIEVYKKFVEFTSEKSNGAIILGWITNQISKENISVEKLTVLLANYKETLNKDTVTSLQSKIDLLTQSFFKYEKESLSAQKSLIKLIDQFLQMQWPPQCKKHKAIIKYINKWNKESNSDTEKNLNRFLKNMPSLKQIKEIRQKKEKKQVQNGQKVILNPQFMQIRKYLSEYIESRFLALDAKIQKNSAKNFVCKDFNQSFMFLTILFDLCGKEAIESMIQQSRFKKFIRRVILEDIPLKEGLISMLSTLKKLDVFGEGKDIQILLIDKMANILSDDKANSVHQNSEITQKDMKKIEHSEESKNENQLLYCVKALRYFSFSYESFWDIYSKMKLCVFRKKTINLYGHELKRQVVKSCLYIIEKLQITQQCKNILADALKIIGQEDSLKNLYIEWVNMNTQFYNKKLFQVYNTSEGLQELIHDYTSKNIQIRKFAIKILCLLYPYNQCEIIPFLKKTYYQIYERISIIDLVDFDQKIIGLKLIREIIKQRHEIVKDDTAEFAHFLYHELCLIIKHNYLHNNHVIVHSQLLIQILKTTISLVKISKECMLPYVKTLGFHLISLINSKVTSHEVKKYCLETFKEMTFYCGYVILPYFYHKNLLLMFRQIIKTDDRNHIYRNSLMKLIGSLGYVSKQKFFRLKRITDTANESEELMMKDFYKLVQKNFEETFKETSFLKQIKLIQKASIKDPRDLKQKQVKESQDFKDSPEILHLKELRESKFTVLGFREQKQNKDYDSTFQLQQIKPFPPIAPYYIEEKVNYKVSNDNFNYKKMIIEKVLQNMNQQSSPIIFYNTFKALESFIFILPKSDEQMYQGLIFSKIFRIDHNNNSSEIGSAKLALYSKQKDTYEYIGKDEWQKSPKKQKGIESESYPLNNVLSLLVKIIFFQDFKPYISQLFHFFLLHIKNEQKTTMILQCLYVVTSRNSEFINFDLKEFLLVIRQHVLRLSRFIEIHRNKDLPDQSINLAEAKHQIRICFAVLGNLSKQLDNFLHLFLPDFNRLFIKQPQEICQTYFSLLMKFFQNCPSTQHFLSQISDRMLDLLISELQILNSFSKPLIPGQQLKNKGYRKGECISFINNIIDFLISILLIFGDKFKGFSERFHSAIHLNRYNSHIFYSIVEDFMKKNSSFHNLHYFFDKNELNEIMKFQKMSISLKTQDDAIIKNVYKHQSLLNFNIINEMIENFTCDQNEVEEQSEEWFVMLSVSVFQKSEDPFTRACLPIVKQDKTLCNDLFPMAFYFYWNILNNQFRRRLTMKLKNILESKGISLKVKQKFIDTIYFMEQQNFPIPIADKVLKDASEQVLDLAKSLFYMEKLFFDEPQSHGQNLIKLYTEIGETESALGLLSIVKNLTSRSQIELYLKLNQYKEAMLQFQKLKDKNNIESLELNIKIKKVQLVWDSIEGKLKNTQYRKALSQYAVESSINLGKWESVSNLLADVEQTHEKYNFWKAILCLHEKKYEQVSKYIKKHRELIYPKICQLFNFSFQRKMEGVIRLQVLTELEQANEYLKVQQNTACSEQERRRNSYLAIKKKGLIENVWNDRIEGANTNLWSFHQLMLIRSLLFTKTEDIQNWINFSRLALKQNQPELAKKTLQILQSQMKDSKYASKAREQKDRRKHEFIIETLLVECEFMNDDFKDFEAVAQIQKLIEQKGTSGSHHEYFFKSAMWLSENELDFTIEKAKKCIALLSKAVTDLKTYIKGWHYLGLMHSRILQIQEDNLKKKHPNPMTSKPSERKIISVLSSSKEIEQSDLNNLNTTRIQKDKDSREHDSKELIKETKELKDLKQIHVLQALKCFIGSVKCGVNNHQYFLEDCLKIMNIIFTEHEVEGVVTCIMQQCERIPSDGLIEVIPQIVGRLDVFDKPVLLDIMKKFLIHIGQFYPQAIIFPLIFCRKSGNTTKKKAADQIFLEIAGKEKSFYNKLEKQTHITQILADAQKIAEQLIKVSLKLKQKFFINFNKIYRSSVTKGICNRQIASTYISFISKILEDDLTLTFSEYGFVQQYGQELRDIKRKFTAYLDFNQNHFFKKAEEAIKNILDEISVQLKNFNHKTSLEEASPELCSMNQSKVSLFGQYNPNSDPIYILSFKNQLSIIPSKQRPKKIVITGSNSKDYNYLLKGKEDLRLDERIMQLFSLINKMFYDPSERENYSIKGYSITPISMEIGIISWVENCDTIGELICKGRSSSKVYLESQLSYSICPAYQSLPIAQKVEIYKEICQKVSGTDLKNILWTRSSSSQEWLKSRSCFTRSLAVMSIVGYIIGLGDRHPNNIMIQRDTGQIVHIDFGDCFDVTKMRKEFPEKVPFRLTRMLVKAMQPCGVHGIFKQTCKKIMKLLRTNKESIITIVQAFRYDPLIGWRLVKDGDDNEGMLEHSYDENDISFLTQKDKMFGEDKNRKDEEKKQNRSIDFGLHILNEIKKKVNGLEFEDSAKLAVSPQNQVLKLLNEAVSPQNLVQHYEGWQIYW